MNGADPITFEIGQGNPVGGVFYVDSPITTTGVVRALGHGQGDTFDIDVYFVPHYVTGLRYDDKEISELILENMKNKERCKIVTLSYASEFRDFLSTMSMVISSKMHPAVLCTSAFVPSLCIAYDHKQMGFFKHLGMEDNVIKIQEISNKILFKKTSRLFKTELLKFCFWL